MFGRRLSVIVGLLVPASAPVRLVIDDTLFRRSGRRVFGAAWQHDPLGWAAARSPEPTPG